MESPRRLLLIAACLVVAGVFGGLLGKAMRKEPTPPPPPPRVGLPAPTESLGGILYCEKAQRLALYWKDGGFELWDTESGRRLGEPERLPHSVGWCVASPDQRIIAAGARTSWS